MATQETTTTMSNLLSTYYDRVLLEKLLPELRLYEFGCKRPLPKNEGKTVKFNRYDVLDLTNVSLLTEGTKPANKIDITTTQIISTIRQIGAYTDVSDLLTLTAIDNTIKSVTESLGEQAALALDTYIRNTLLDPDYTAVFPTSPTPAQIQSELNAGNTIFPPVFGGDAERLDGANEVDASDVITVATIRDATKQLRAVNAKPFNDGFYVGIIHPNAAAKLEQDSIFIEWNRYTSAELMHKGEIGRVEGVRFVLSTNMWNASNGTTQVYNTVILSPHAFGITEIDGGIKTYVKTPNQYDTSNPINQWN